ncbi:DNA polymerase III, subunit gamma and tau [Fusobacterium necrophorum subsp. funduliforme ATCC 51357]|uniref:DNA polymerase III subunit gamma/tau n=1 Tax=Fusobacterium necrophorum subsp. funduliforme TaxID=143387 RepID=A0A162IX89_9FUSO|nr:DNA polymerase III subunit gamma/tau [Fusobacterium necrophorum]AVQ21037.1 DNA polymerase III subunit gamma/tau [Fusobacterium necrophorum subsp. funduliforme]AYV92742.1 DNA polymerase III subunit gamma/tau [Fusobacterium necrophorum subsp. funduliforme]EIJ67994.1 DNA polymerase III, subunit gamma and tau [Fusobacterium necrophorum subsp. funduliforme ATCC 51357]EYD69620.1 DNA polymerase III subunits gamma/tau [Fusobacterium necrophorum subsp. funduliforme B35]KAB0553860.1 DNA polymerase II
MYITLYRKYRPSSFQEVAGEQEIVRALKNALKNNQLSQAYLFTGPRGVGKTTIARLIAKSVNCLEPKEDGEACGVCENCTSFQEGSFLDLVEIDAASNRGIDEIRLLKEKINYQPSQGKKKVYIIDEVHMLTKEAFNALLKTLEEPPAHVIFILATTEPDKILPTIISRCQRYDFKTLSLQDMGNQLQYILSRENLEMEEEVKELIYEASGGSMRDAISVLERLIVSSSEKKISLEESEKILGMTPIQKMEQFLHCLLQEEKKTILRELDELWFQSVDMEAFLKDFAKFIKNQIKKEKLEVEKGLFIIKNIYEVLNIFRLEEDKRLVAYVLVEKLQKRESTAVPVEKKKVFLETAKTETSISLAEIQNRWEEIIDKAREEKISMGVYLSTATLHSLEDNVLTLCYEESNLFSKEQMEEKQYSSILLKVLEEEWKQKFKLRVLTVANEGKRENHVTKKILNYFGGEIIS